MMRFHTNLPVADIKKTIQFYTTLLGDVPVKTKSDYAKFLPETGGLNLSFHQVEGGAAQMTKLHLGFELLSQEALNHAHERLLQAGLVSSARETSVCCYANQDKFWVTDPDGYKWELYVLLEDTDLKISENSGCCGGTQSEPLVTAGCC